MTVTGVTTDLAGNTASVTSGPFNIDVGPPAIDISLSPHPGPLRRELLAHLAAHGPATVTELRTFALTETIYRAADATRVLHNLVETGAVTREPEHGRLGGDVMISAA